MWKIDLEITDGVVYWWTESESQPLYKQQICKLKNNDATKFATILDLKGNIIFLHSCHGHVMTFHSVFHLAAINNDFVDLHLTVITPLVRTNVNGIRVR